MSPLEYLNVLRRRWLVLVLSTLVVVSAGWALSRRTSAADATGPTYSANAIILGSSKREGLSDLETLAALVKVGNVPERVAGRLGREDAVALGLGIQTIADDRTGLLTITARAQDREEAELIANTFARELLAFVEAREKKDIKTQLSLLVAEQDVLNDEIVELEQQIRGANRAEAADLEADLQVAEGRLRLLEASTLQLSNSLAASSGAQVIQEAQGVRVARDRDGAGAAGAPALAAIGALGLLVGIAVVAILERFNTRIRTKRAAEEHFGRPVLTEIPLLRGRRRRRAGTIAATAPYSLSGDAYRLLAAGIAGARNDRPGLGRAWPAEPETIGSPRGGDIVVHGRSVAPAVAPPPTLARPLPPPVGLSHNQTILVVSAGPGEGKTTVVSNLAASFSDMGTKTLVLSCDFHRPSIHEVLRIPNDRGVAEAMIAVNGTAVLDGCIVKATIESIDFDVAPTGAAPEHPAELLNSSRAKRMLAEARGAAEVVIIDTSPILDASDATALLPYVDSVVIVARAGRTTADEAKRTSELLERLSAPTTWVALNAVREPTMWSKRTKATSRRHRSKRVEKTARPA